MGCSLFGIGGYYSPWIGLLMLGVRVAIFVWLVIMISKIFKNYKQKNNHSESIKILDEMFIKGDIDEEEYTRKRKILND